MATNPNYPYPPDPPKIPCVDAEQPKQVLPSAADLDAVAAEDEAAQETQQTVEAETGSSVLPASAGNEAEGGAP